MVGRASNAVHSTDRFHLFEVGGVLRRSERGDSIRSELIAGGQCERRYRAPAWQQGGGIGCRGWVPITRIGSRCVGHRGGNRSTIVGSQRENLLSDVRAERDTGGLVGPIGNCGERGHQLSIERGCLGREQGDEHFVGRSGDRSFTRGRRRCGQLHSVRPVSLFERVYRVVNGNMQNRQGSRSNGRWSTRGAKRLQGMLIPIEHHVGRHQLAGVKRFEREFARGLASTDNSRARHVAKLIGVRGTFWASP